MIVSCCRKILLMPHLDRYNVSKLLEVLIVRHLTSLSGTKTAGSGAVVINTVNPGFCHSELGREFTNPLISVVKALIARTAEEGSRNLILAASAGKESHGQYITNGHVARYVAVTKCQYMLLC